MAKKFSWWLAGIGGFLLLLELLFRVLPVSTSTETGYYIDPLILNYPPHHHWTIATGWDLRNAQRLESNNFGYVASRDFGHNPQAVALIGDSFIEASMLSAADRPGAQLERALGSRPVFAMGNPGTALLDYAERIRFARETFGVRDFVVLMERGDVKQSLCGSGNINGPCLDPKTLAARIEKIPAPGTAKRIFRHSALAQYVFGQLKFNPQKLWQQAFPPPHSAAPLAKSLATNAGLPNQVQVVPPFVDVVTTAFFDRIKPFDTGRLVIVLDSDRRALAAGQLTADPSRARFIELALAAGAVVVDTEPLFQAHFARSSLTLDVGPYDGHLNPLGVGLVMQAAATALLNSPLRTQ
jgi:hypothetical protein